MLVRFGRVGICWLRFCKLSNAFNIVHISRQLPLELNFFHAD